MPPLNSRSTGASRIARISSTGVRRLHAVGQPERGAHRLGDRDRLRRPRPDPAAGADPRAVVVGPRRALQAEQPLALGEGGRRVGRRGRRTRAGGRTRRPAGCARDSSIPLPKTSPDMSPTPTTVKSCFCDVDVELAEVPGDRLPGAAGGDAHGLVVVADRAAGGEGVAQPEAALERDGVGQVGEGRRPLVGGDDEVGVVAVVPDHPLGRDDLAPSTRLSVSDSSAPMNILVAGLPLGQDGVAGGAVGQAAA